MASLILQAGHYPDGGGAPGEAQWTRQVAVQVAADLEAVGIECTIVGDWLNKQAPPAVERDHDLFLSIHYDAAVYGAGNNTGCFADRARFDPMAAESDRFIRIWENVYPRITGIPLRNERRNPNTWDYYAFRDTTPNTPGVILELGCGAPVGVGGFPPGEDADFLHQHVHLVATAIAEAVRDFLDIPPDEGEEEMDGIVIELHQQIEALRAEIASKDSTIGAMQAHIIAPLQEENAALKERVAELEALPPPPVPEPPLITDLDLRVLVTLDNGTTLERSLLERSAPS